MVIRPKDHSQTETTWQIVGPVLVPGLMHGEAIYKDNLPAHYEAKEVTKGESGHLLIDGRSYAMHDTVKDIFFFDPAEVLEEANIKVEKYERDPHVLEVLAESLRIAGITLEEFRFV